MTNEVSEDFQKEVDEIVDKYIDLGLLTVTGEDEEGEETFKASTLFLAITELLNTKMEEIEKRLKRLEDHIL